VSVISAPTLLVWGEQDQRSSLEVAADLAQRISGSELVVLPGAGHLPQMEAAGRFNMELRSFLRRVGQG
jgi:pimeloyl-ACP methyl ester carboxylesterase